MRSLPVLIVLLALLTSAAFGQGWVGQQLVNRPNRDTGDFQPTVATDRTGRPWVVWGTNCGDSMLLWARWLGSGWEPQHGVSRDAPGIAGRVRPDLAFGEEDTAWLVWCNAYENNTHDIAACYWDGSQWTPEQLVNLFDSTDLDFAPRVACGGGQVWCVWFGGPTDMSPYSVYASRWSDYLGAWEPEMQVSPADGNHHWWCDVTVDTFGTPHVVWSTYQSNTVFYSYFDGQQWVAPIPVNDTAQILATYPRIVTDGTGTMHLSFTGAGVGAVHSDIFYSRNDGSGWIPCQMVTRDGLYNEMYSEIAADRPDNVWVTWDRQGEGSEQYRVYAAHFDGQLWSTEVRLDNDSSDYDDTPVVCLDSLGCPWVVWNTNPYSALNFDVVYNRFVGAGITEAQPGSAVYDARLRCATLQSGPGLSASVSLSDGAQVRLALYDETGRCKAVLVDGHMPKGAYTVRCRESLAPGAYLCRLEAEGQSEVSKVILLGH
ncbi:MAG: hypothetical protein NTX53_03540 [candidate division WOR-3 bacterium]|nr:hypothetical protein [candidate division WOR-3 bacterium]